MLCAARETTKAPAFGRTAAAYGLPRLSRRAGASSRTHYALSRLRPDHLCRHGADREAGDPVARIRFRAGLARRGSEAVEEPDHTGRGHGLHDADSRRARSRADAAA